jgi:hypothetical protein
VLHALRKNVSRTPLPARSPTIIRVHVKDRFCTGELSKITGRSAHSGGSESRNCRVVKFFTSDFLKKFPALNRSSARQQLHSVHDHVPVMRAAFVDRSSCASRTRLNWNQIVRARRRENMQRRERGTIMFSSPRKSLCSLINDYERTVGVF